MKKVLPILLVIAVVAVALFFVLSKNNPTGAAGLNFEMKFKPGEIDKYKMTMDMTMNMPNMPRAAAAASSNTQMNMTMLMTMETLSVNPDGSAKVKYKISDMKMNMPGVLGGLRTMPDVELTATMSKDGKTSNVEGMSNVPGMAMSGVDMNKMMSNFSGIMLPGKPIRIGETWEGQMPSALGGNLATQFRLDSDNQPIGSAKAAKITSTFSYKGTLADLMKQVGKASALPSGMNGNVDISGTGTTYFDPAAGKTLKTDADIVEKMDMQLPTGAAPGAPQNMQMNMTMKMHMEKI